MSSYGVVYSISNPAYSHLVKIGFTVQGSAAMRARSLDSTAVPKPMIVLDCICVSDVRRVERQLHVRFIQERTRDNREWFHVSPEMVRAAFAETEGARFVSPDFDPSAENAPVQVQVELQRPPDRQRMPNIDFIAMGLNIGDVIEFYSAPISARIAGKKHIELNGGVTSLSAATKEILGTRHNVSLPTIYWTFQGESLREFYVRAFGGRRVRPPAIY